MTLAVGDDWVSVGSQPIAFDTLTSWVVRPSCGAVVAFAGTVRDHAEGRPGVVSLEYEAYEQAAQRQLADIATRMRQQWPTIGAIALLHRTGILGPGDVSVAVAVSAPHRPEAFDAARWGIDVIKAEVPIWKKETWQGGSAWGLGTHPLAGAGHDPQSDTEHTEHTDNYDSRAPGSASACR
ncbi:MAG TPA: molybdenum cofactor biosynthesis protein MoaE [Acidimicrobiales bacterium]|nr:molybdenum cofactor biosynthesis protein MoaE [Acidimicrobiales bacterium]